MDYGELFTSDTKHSFDTLKFVSKQVENLPNFNKKFSKIKKKRYQIIVGNMKTEIEIKTTIIITSVPFFFSSSS